MTTKMNMIKNSFVAVYISAGEIINSDGTPLGKITSSWDTGNVTHYRVRDIFGQTWYGKSSDSVCNLTKTVSSLLPHIGVVCKENGFYFTLRESIYKEPMALSVAEIKETGNVFTAVCENYCRAIFESSSLVNHDYYQPTFEKLLNDLKETRNTITVT